MLADELRKIALANKEQSLKVKTEFLVKQAVELAKTKASQGQTEVELGSSNFKFSLEEAASTVLELEKLGFKCHVIVNKLMSGGSFYDHQYEHAIQVSWA